MRLGGFLPEFHRLLVGKTVVAVGVYINLKMFFLIEAFQYPDFSIVRVVNSDGGIFHLLEMPG